jgi:putative SbcD/Mre11-related phosphoesterase
VKVRPLYPHAALWLEDKKYLAVTDLHIGLENELGLKGILMSSSTPDMNDELLGLVEQEHADGVILLGDLKHTIGSISKQEWDEIPAFLNNLSARSEVYLVPGNHDGNIRHLVPPSVNVVSAKGMTFGDTLFLHGHSMPSDVRSNVNRIVMGHLHPVFLKRESVIHGERVWIYIRTTKAALFASEGALEVVVVPSFNPHLQATQKYYHRSISPILTRVIEHGIEKCIVTMLDGSVVGNESILSSIF